MNTHKKGPRPCEVNGLACTFHGFIEEDKAFLKINSFCRTSEAEAIFEEYRTRGLIPPSAELVTARTCTALVETKDGGVHRVDPENVRFTDRRAKR